VIFSAIEKLILHKYPLRVALWKRLIRQFNLGSYQYRTSIDAVIRPQYAYCMVEAALLARDHGIKKISAIEFGVAGGNGLVNIEAHAREIHRELGVEFEIYGFDSGEGMPASTDYRDVLYYWPQGSYKMDQATLERRLTASKLILGDVRETTKTFIKDYGPAPIGCVFFDLDYYSSTLPAFQVFDAPSERHLPRVACHFDDVSATNKFIGELCAVKAFNAAHDTMKIAQHHMLAELRRIPMPWNHEIYYFHNFSHPRYNECHRGTQQLHLS
tara:strand:- start:10299 stop:11111 length:813 start_codon:yes stop_codon:yes gene_type:complete